MSGDTTMANTPINLKHEQMAEALGFSAPWLEEHRQHLIECGAVVYEGRWHIASTENAFVEAAHRGLFTRTKQRGADTGMNAGEHRENRAGRRGRA